MKPVIFSDNLLVEIEGSYVLQFESFFSDYVEYSVIGFHEQVILRDYRSSGIAAINHVLISGDISRFPDGFNGQAHATIFDLTDHEPMIVELREPTSHFSHYLLWIVVGLGKEIPIYDYVFGLMQELDSESYAFVAIADLKDDNVGAGTNSTYSSSENSVAPSVFKFSSSI